MLVHRHFNKNDHGTDYVVGDLHGHYSLLMQHLEKIGFDWAKDRLFACGDLIDRGPESEACIDLLCEPWFFSVAGNHDRSFVLSLRDRMIRNQLISMGGQWIRNHNEEDLQMWGEIMDSYLSLAITLETDQGQLGIIHGEAPKDWHVLLGPIGRPQWQSSTWSFLQSQLARKGQDNRIENIDQVVCGHISSKFPVRGKNQYWIDTLARSGQFTLIPVSDAFPKNNETPG